MTDCPKCRGRMTQGFPYLPDTGGRVKWMDGEPGFWSAVTGMFRTKSVELNARRCTDCGFVEFFAESQAKPVKTLRSIDEENERLRNLVTKLQERVSTLETIATDPAERTAREIESLRHLPPSGESAKPD
jgi:predicted nucleic-acid-binding Zn-ribbon protein